MDSHGRHLHTRDLSSYLQGRETILTRRMGKHNCDQWHSFCKWCSGRWMAHTEWDIRKSRYLVWRKRLYLTWKVSLIRVETTFDATSKSSTIDGRTYAIRKGRHTEDRVKELSDESFFPILNITIGCSSQSNVESKHPLVCQNEDPRKSDAPLLNTVTVPQPIWADFPSNIGLGGAFSAVPWIMGGSRKEMIRIFKEPWRGWHLAFS